MAEIIINMSEEGRARSFLDEDFKRLEKLGDLKRYDLNPVGKSQFQKDLGTADAVLMGQGYLDLKEEMWSPRDKPLFVAYARGAIHRVVPKILLRQGVRLSSAAAALADSVAEFTVGLIIMGLRQAYGRNAAYSRGEAFRLIKGQEWVNWRYHDLTARTVGLIGLSQIGSRMPNLLKAFVCRILAYDPYWNPTAANDLGVRLIPELDNLIERSDVVSLHTPVTDETKRMIDKRRSG